MEKAIFIKGNTITPTLEGYTYADCCSLYHLPSLSTINPKLIEYNFSELMLDNEQKKLLDANLTELNNYLDDGWQVKMTERVNDNILLILKKD